MCPLEGVKCRGQIPLPTIVSAGHPARPQPSITDTTFALQFPNMLIIHAVIEHDGRSAVSARHCTVWNRWLAAPGHTRASGAVAGDGLPELSR